VTVSRRANSLAYLAFSPANHAKFCSSDQIEIFFCLDWQITLTKSFQLWPKIFRINVEQHLYVDISQSESRVPGVVISDWWAASRLRSEDQTGARHQRLIAALEPCPSTCRVRHTTRLGLSSTSHADTSSGHPYGRSTKFYFCCISHTKLRWKTHLRQSRQTERNNRGFPGVWF